METDNKEKELYSHVCTECEEPLLWAKESFVKRTASNVRDSVIVTFGFLVLIAVSIPFGILAVPVWILYFFFVYVMFQKQNKCPKCDNRSLIPVATPKGMQIMEKHGWDVIQKNS